VVFEKIIYLMFIVFCLFIFFRRLLTHLRKKCKKCGGKQNLHEIKDPLGINISNKVTLSFYVGPRKRIETWVCVDCGFKEKIKYLGS
jgi:hypothetical protein